MRTWKSAQTTPKNTPNIQPKGRPWQGAKQQEDDLAGIHVAEQSQECDSGFEMYSTMLNRKLRGHRSGVGPERRAESSWMKPHAFRGWRSRSSAPHGKREREGRIDVRRRNHPEPWCARAPRDGAHQVGRGSPWNSSAGHTKNRECQRRDELVRIAVENPLTWSVTNSKISSPPPGALVGTPDVAPFATTKRIQSHELRAPRRR